MDSITSIISELSPFDDAVLTLFVGVCLFCICRGILAQFSNEEMGDEDEGIMDDSYVPQSDWSYDPNDVLVDGDVAFEELYESGQAEEGVDFD